MRFDIDRRGEVSIFNITFDEERLQDTFDGIFIGESLMSFALSLALALRGRQGQARFLFAVGAASIAVPVLARVAPPVIDKVREWFADEYEPGTMRPWHNSFDQ